MKKALALIFLFLPGIVTSKENPPCRQVPGYQLRYTNQDKKNSANNVLWLEDSKSFRILEIRGAECARISIVGTRVFWLEYPSHVIYGYDVSQHFLETYSEGGQFIVSPDAERLVVEREGSLSVVNLRSKDEVAFAQLPGSSLSPGENAAVFLGWTSDGDNFWFAFCGPNKRPLEFQVLTHRGDLIVTNMRADPLLESVFNVEQGWLTQNNGTELSVFELMSEKRVVLASFPVGTKVRPHWTVGGHLKYVANGKENTVLSLDLRKQLDASSSSGSTISKKSFVPVSW